MTFKDLMSTKLTSKMLREPGQAKEEPNLHKRVLIVNLAVKTHYVNQVKNVSIICSRAGCISIEQLITIKLIPGKNSENYVSQEPKWASNAKTLLV